ncbi:hypothetical protein B0T14DRAFT_525477 [Immersiella caudata]|uniref:Azaphilone pigments biosynthesis cluster protein L N-terminal domain-containing protein n=1 Tax=Immersiella caudata TaxID=314043 RepID=A0AA39WLE5_9PEZI|nr:hypothetical protein B0T14DRAFT_525477 [Immersiella caudata]
MAEPLSLAASCLAVITAVGQTTKLIRDFVHKYRNARVDVIRLTWEMSSLSIVLQSLHDMVSDEARISAAVPARLRSEVNAVVHDSGKVLEEIDAILKQHIMGPWTRVSWALTGKRKICDRILVLEGNRKSLDLSLTTIDFTLSNSIKEDTTIIRNDAALTMEKLEEIAQHLMITQPPQNDTHSDEAETVAGKLYHMRRFFESLSTYSESAHGAAGETPGQPIQETADQDGETSPRSALMNSLRHPSSTPAAPATDPQRNDTMAKFLFAILQQQSLKNIDWQKVSQDPLLGPTQRPYNGHAARMRYFRFKAKMYV